MIGTRFEGYRNRGNGLPFVLNTDLERTMLKYSREQNWHEELEIQLCREGSGSILINGREMAFLKGDIAVINSGVIHYTGSRERLVYSCIIISTEFLEQVGLSIDRIHFEELVHSSILVSLMEELEDAYKGQGAFRETRLYCLLLQILTELAEKHSSREPLPQVGKKAFENVKGAIKYIKNHYGEKITLDRLAREACTDKYTLCRDFKRLTGQTVVEYINRLRCQRAADLISEGATVSEAATECGFENLSFFTRCFKRYMKKLPSACKRH